MDAMEPAIPDPFVGTPLAAVCRGGVDCACAGWSEAETSLPDGWYISNVRRRSLTGRYSASATLAGSETGISCSGFGATPAAALRDLAETLKARASR